MCIYFMMVADDCQNTSSPFLMIPCRSWQDPDVRVRYRCSPDEYNVFLVYALEYSVCNEMTDTDLQIQPSVRPVPYPFVPLEDTLVFGQ